MTESTFPFEASGEEPAAPADRRKMALVAGAGALAVAVLGYFVVVPMLSGSDSSSEAAIVRRPAAAAKKAAPAAKKPAAKKPAAQPQTYADTSARKDPFRPLVVLTQAAPNPVAPLVPGGTDTGTNTGGGTGTNTGGGTNTGTNTGGSSTTVGAQRVSLVLVYAKDGKSYAQTKIGDQVYTPVVGEVFGGSFKLLAVSGKSATYLFGDEQFTLTEGQEVLK